MYTNRTQQTRRQFTAQKCFKMNAERLIESVKGYSLLYDLNDCRYSDSQKKDEAWKKVSQQMRVKEKDCKRAWALLRDSFRRALKKQKDLQSSGHGNGIIRKWKYQDQMSFLRPYLKERRMAAEAIESEPALIDECSVPSTSCDEFSFEKVTPKDESADSLEPASNPPADNEIRQRKLLLPKKPIIKKTPSALMKYLLDNAKSTDDVDQFFASMATTVKSFSQHERAIAKARVFEVVSKMEIEISSHASSSSIVNAAENDNQFESSEYKFSQTFPNNVDSSESVKYEPAV